MCEVTRCCVTALLYLRCAADNSNPHDRWQPDPDRRAARPEDRKRGGRDFRHPALLWSGVLGDLRGMLSIDRCHTLIISRMSHPWRLSGGTALALL
jgi:hypothetical protein